MTHEMYDIIHEMADKTLSGFCNQATWKDFDDSGVVSQDHWETLRESGLLQAGLSEENGGASLDLADIMKLVGLSAYHACPLPMAETLIGFWIAETIGLPVGSADILTFADDALGDLPSISAEGEVSGNIIRVPFGNVASHILLRCKDGKNASNIACVHRHDIEDAPEVVNNLAGIPLASFRLNAARAVGFKPAHSKGHPLELRSLGALMRCCQMAGAMRRAVDITVAYVMERNQFGRPLGKFQAVQQMIAIAAEHAVSSETVSMAAAQHNNINATSLLIASSKSWVGEGVQPVADACHQSHGAMGFTQAYHLHHFTRRLWSWRDEFGTEFEWQQKIGQMATSAGPEGLWSMITETPLRVYEMTTPERTI